MKELENFEDIKDVIDEANKLNELYNSKKYNKMNKYFIETLTCNSINKVMPHTVEQQDINTNSFLRAQSAKTLNEKRLTSIENY